MAEQTEASRETSTSKRAVAETSRERGTQPERTTEHTWNRAHLTDGLANSAVLRLLHGETQGRPLDPHLRMAMEARLGADLSRVRVHTGPRAAASADALSARAYTVGQDIVFGPGEYRPAGTTGRALLVHELHHAVEQARGETAVGIARQAKEGEGSAAPAAADDSLGWLGNAVVEATTHQVVGSGIQQRMLSAAVRGFVAELGRQLKAEDVVARVKSSFRELLLPQNLTRFAGGYTAGAVAGLVSPVTDLLGLGQLAEQLPQIAGNLLRRVYAQSRQLGQEALELAQSIQKFVDEAPGKLIALLKDPAKIHEVIEQQGPKAVDAASGAGRQAAREIVGFFTSKEEKEEPEESVWHALTTFAEGESISHPIGLAVSRGTRVRKAVFSTPWSDFGYRVGHAVGAVVSNVLLFIFSEGVGNAISKIAAGLGDVAPLLAGKLARVGEAVAAVEHAIGAAIGAAAKLVKPLEEVMGPLLRLMERLRAFLRRLLGVAEYETAELAARGASAVAGRTGGKAAGTGAGRTTVPGAKASTTAARVPTTAGTTTSAAERETATVSAEAPAAAPESTVAPSEPAATSPEGAEIAPAPTTPPEAPAMATAVTTAEGTAGRPVTDVPDRPAWLSEAGTQAGRPRPKVSATTRRQQAQLARQRSQVSQFPPPKAKPPLTPEPAVQSVPEIVAAEEATEEAVTLEASTGAPVNRPVAMASGGRRSSSKPSSPPKRPVARERPGATVTPIRRGGPPKPRPGAESEAQLAPEAAPEVATEPSAARLGPVGDVVEGRTPAAFPMRRGRYSVEGKPDPRLLMNARELRSQHAGVTLGDFTSKNVVVAKVWVGPRPVGSAPGGAFEYIDVTNVTAGELGAEFGFHSEGVLAEQLRRRKGVVLVELYSERIPCWRCAKLLKDNFSEAAVFYTVRGRGDRGRKLMEAYGLLRRR